MLTLLVALAVVESRAHFARAYGGAECSDETFGIGALVGLNGVRGAKDTHPVVYNLRHGCCFLAWQRNGLSPFGEEIE